MLNHAESHQDALQNMVLEERSISQRAEMIPIAEVERFLVQLLDSIGGQRFDDRTSSYAEFHEKMSGMAQRLSECSTLDEKFLALQQTLYEIHRYQESKAKDLRKPEFTWRALAATLLCALFTPHDAKRLSAGKDRLLGEAMLRDLNDGVDTFEGAMRSQPEQDVENRPWVDEWRPSFEAELNPTSLRCGDAALSRVEELLQRGAKGFAIVFRLGCLDVVGERFGLEALEESVRAVTGYLSESIQRYGELFYWNESTFVTVVETRAPEKSFRTTIVQIVNNNRSAFVQVGDHLVLLQMPLEFEMFSILGMKSAKEFCERLG